MQLATASVGKFSRSTDFCGKKHILDSVVPFVTRRVHTSYRDVSYGFVVGVQVQVVSRFSKFHVMMAGSWPVSLCRGRLSASMKLINFQSFYFVSSYLLTCVFSHCQHNSVPSCICLHMFYIAVLMIGSML